MMSLKSLNKRVYHINNSTGAVSIVKQNLLLSIFNRKLLLDIILSFRENIIFNAWLIAEINHMLLTDLSYSTYMSQWAILLSMHLNYDSFLCIYDRWCR